MVRTYLKWCPNGCGKCVVYNGREREKIEDPWVSYFICKRCNNRFTKDQLKGMNKFPNRK